MRVCKLNVGDTVNGHEYGWMTVKSIEKNRFECKVVYDTMFGDIHKYYLYFEEVETI